MTPAQCNGDTILTHMVLRKPAGVGSHMCSFHEDNLQRKCNTQDCFRWLKAWKCVRPETAGSGL